MYVVTPTLLMLIIVPPLSWSVFLHHITFLSDVDFLLWVPYTASGNPYCGGGVAHSMCSYWSTKFGCHHCRGNVLIQRTNYCHTRVPYPSSAQVASIL